MDFLIADTFTDALARLPAQEQKAAKTSAFDLQLDPSSPGLQFHRIDRSKDPNFWSMRVNRDLRIIVHKTAASILLVYVDHHDRAYAWAERRRIETHPTTGAAQIVEVRERVEEATPQLFQPTFAFAGVADGLTQPPLEPPLFAALKAEDLLSVGVPEDWVEPVLSATEARFYEIAQHLPGEAAEALLQYAAGAPLARPEPQPASVTPFEHPDALRRFREVGSEDELRAALDAPWERWSIFLHPSQRDVVDRVFNGPARVAGSAGTGKTVVALHRAVRLARSNPAARVLLTTFSQPLAEALKPKLAVLTAADPSVRSRVSVMDWNCLADDLHQLAFGRRPRIASREQVDAAVRRAGSEVEPTGLPDRFIATEFRAVVDAWQVDSLDAYNETPRLGRRSRLGARQREKLWPLFECARQHLEGQGLTTWASVFAKLTAYYAERAEKPFDHIVVDEAQDLGVPELRLLSVLATPGGDALFFAGDMGQRIFQQPFSWKALGVDVRGRASMLKVNYRTSQQIREAADRLLPAVVRDVDGREESRRGTVSVFEGPSPEVTIFLSGADEQHGAAAFLREVTGTGAAPAEVGVFVRSRAELDRARAAVKEAGFTPVEAGDAARDGGVLVGTMHLAKGLEFKAVLVLACDAEVLPLSARIATATDEAELDEVYETERQLLYVACTRARDRLMVTSVKPGSEFLADLV